MKKTFGFLLGSITVALVVKRTIKTFRTFTSNRNSSFFYEEMLPSQIGVPVFTYHSIAPQVVPDSVNIPDFERGLEYLSRNGYHTLDTCEFYNFLTTGESLPPKSVMITFDDGRASLWTHAFPLIQKYGIKVVSFLIPGIMKEKGIHCMNNFMNSGIDELEDLSENAEITWEEARIMHDSGLVDFQSHTLNHTTVFYSPEIIDFVHPSSGFGYHNFGSPIFRNGGIDELYSIPKLGTPIYRNQPRMGAARRFFDDQELREACNDWVEEKGGGDFFMDPAWRQRLFGFVHNYLGSHPFTPVYESREEQSQAILYDLTESRRLIESHLPNHPVQHLVYPWNHFSILAAKLAIQAGYLSTYIDINPRKYPIEDNNPYSLKRILPLNEFGDDPYLVTRLDGRNQSILSLPGEGRLAFSQRVLEKMFEIPERLRKQ
jgi:hypothetical protein